MDKLAAYYSQRAAEGELIQRASRYGWGANVDLLEHYWLLSWWASK